MTSVIPVDQARQVLLDALEAEHADLVRRRDEAPSNELENRLRAQRAELLGAITDIDVQLAQCNAEKLERRRTFDRMIRDCAKEIAVVRRLLDPETPAAAVARYRAQPAGEYACQWCDRSFGNQHGLVVHQSRMHKAELAAMPLTADEAADALREISEQATEDKLLAPVVGEIKPATEVYGPTPEFTNPDDRACWCEDCINDEGLALGYLRPATLREHKRVVHNVTVLTKLEKSPRRVSPDERKLLVATANG